MSIRAATVDSQLVAGAAGPVSGQAVGRPAQSGAADSLEVAAAVAQVREALLAQANPPKFSIDYLSGLGVMQVRAADSGELIFQIPNISVVKLARLMKEGVALDSVGLFNTEA